jgi:Bacterial Ig-like domain (group 2)
MSTQNITGQVSWASSDNAVATVSNVNPTQGLATGQGMGTASISATLGGVSGGTTLTVTSATLMSIAVAPVNGTIVKATTKACTATGTYSDNSTQDITAQVTWGTSNAGVVTVSNAGGAQGTATGVALGMAMITATLAGKSGQTGVTVVAAQLVSITVTPVDPTIAKLGSKQFTATANWDDNTHPDVTNAANWTSSNGGVASVGNTANLNKGLASAGLNAGMTTISAAYAGKTGMTTLTVQ